MWTTTISALLLPLGIWLILSSATPKADENRVAVSGILTALVASLAFAASGFALMSPGGLTLAISGQAWAVLGNTGFLMGGATASLVHFVPQLALALACALLVSSVIARRANYLVQAAVSAVVGGVLFPIAGKWVLGRGWLATLGQHLNFGHGAVDFGGLATAALVAGIAGLALVSVLPRRQAAPNAGLPIAQFPFRAISGAACVLMGSVTVFGSNPMLGKLADKATLSYFITLSLACAVAALCGLLYSRVTSPQTDSLCATRAMLAAVIMVSSGAGALPVWVAAALGIVAGLLATVGLYIVHEKLHLDDDGALITSALLPGAIGFLVTGLFANGSVGAGWNGVGDTSYLAVSQLGVVGLLPMAATVGDPGQLTAQLIAIGSIGAVSLLGVGVMAYALRPALQTPLVIPVVQAPVQMPMPEPTLTMSIASIAAATPQWSEPIAPARIIEIQPIQAAPALMIEPEPVSITIEKARDVERVAPPPAQPQPDSQHAFAATTMASEKKKAEDGLLDRLRRLRRANLPEQPARARKVAYPIRVNGKRLIRPLVDESSTKS